MYIGQTKSCFLSSTRYFAHKWEVDVSKSILLMKCFIHFVDFVQYLCMSLHESKLDFSLNLFYFVIILVYILYVCQTGFGRSVWRGLLSMKKFQPEVRDSIVWPHSHLSARKASQIVATGGPLDSSLQFVAHFCAHLLQGHYGFARLCFLCNGHHLM